MDSNSGKFDEILTLLYTLSSYEIEKLTESKVNAMFSALYCLSYY